MSISSTDLITIHTLLADHEKRSLCVVTAKIMMNSGNNKISGCVTDMLVDISSSLLFLLFTLALCSVHEVASCHHIEPCHSATVCMDENMQLLNWNNIAFESVSLVKQKTATTNQTVIVILFFCFTAINRHRFLTDVLWILLNDTSSVH